MTQRYDTYKDSGVQWLGEIPGHWECTSLGRVLYEKLQYGASESGDLEYTNDSMRYIRITDITLDGKLKKDCCKYLSSEIGKNYPVRKGDVLLARSGATVGKAFIYNEDNEACYAGYLIKASIQQDKVFPTFFFYFTQTSQYDEWKNRIFIQATIQNISAEKYTRMKLCIPPLSEQHSIVSFLDAKCGKIDEWVTKKQKELEHLQELKQRVIADAVTQGLNPHVKMKATNIPWIKEIPEHWEMRKMKYLFDERSEKNHPDEPMLSATQSEGVILQSKYQGRVVVVNTGFEGLKLVKVGDFVIHLRSFQGGIEYAHDRGIISSAYTILNPKYPEYSAYYKRLFKSSSFIDLLKICVTGIREGQNINYSKLKQFSIPVPPLSEKRSIVSYLDAKCSKIDKLIDNITKEIECIKEYKQRLISDVVTGQIKVCQV
ncbi:MAG: restriction endonuclease subunit S [Prevotella sp.]|nr:restriction endonuclease subunit S [Prevotella sp.]